jgi:hypothetical protein
MTEACTDTPTRAHPDQASIFKGHDLVSVNKLPLDQV